LEKIVNFLISQIGGEGKKKPWYRVKSQGKKITKTFSQSEGLKDYGELKMIILSYTMVP
jgi:ABC-type thiamine transport system substrate-binding protein